ncbi:glutathione S-transferase family protein [Rhizobium sp. G21]|uniref:glutathione S-transferase family protein n=1 Tax=Rhizobium sp. G21 TaxID=2758439 RepID=UPI001600F9F9|nr:glutathione S-transferase family protein [Rhizobium sp. G21]MBB1249381.1 glutathione S-transferase family protein [Rhizobium sp. G21]
MYRLYGRIGSGSAAVEAALAIIGAPHDIVWVDTSAGEHLTEDFAAINPRRQVPAFVLPDGGVMTESAAMLLHLADAFPEAGLAPRPGSSARARHDRWLIFMAVNIYEGELRKAYADRYTTDPDGADAVRAAAEDYLSAQHAIIEAEMKGDYLVGDSLSMADLYLWMVASWRDPQQIRAETPRVAAHSRRLRAIPQVQAIAERHGA